MRVNSNSSLHQKELVVVNSDDILSNKCRHLYQGHQKTKVQFSSFQFPSCVSASTTRSMLSTIHIFASPETPSSHAYCLICKRPGSKLVYVSSSARFSAILRHHPTWMQMVSIPHWWRGTQTLCFEQHTNIWVFTCKQLNNAGTGKKNWNYAPKQIFFWTVKHEQHLLHYTDWYL